MTCSLTQTLLLSLGCEASWGRWHPSIQCCCQPFLWKPTGCHRRGVGQGEKGLTQQGEGLRKQHKLSLLLECICQVQYKCGEWGILTICHTPGVHLVKGKWGWLPLSLPPLSLLLLPSFVFFHLLLTSPLLSYTPTPTQPYLSRLYLVYFQQTWQLICQ